MTAGLESAGLAALFEGLGSGVESGVESGVKSGVEFGVASGEGSMAAALEVEVSRANPIAPPMSRLTESSATMAMGVLRDSLDKCDNTEPREKLEGKSILQS